jgi:hypothetical protein
LALEAGEENNSVERRLRAKRGGGLSLGRVVDNGLSARIRVLGVLDVVGSTHASYYLRLAINQM